MPLFDFLCSSCMQQFEKLVLSDDEKAEPVTCPHCGGKKVERLLSAPTSTHQTPSKSCAPTGRGFG